MSKTALLIRNSRTGIILLGIAMHTPFKRYAQRIAIELFYMGPTK